LLHANSLAMGRLSGPVAQELQLPSIAHLRDILKLSAQAVADLNCHRRLLAVSNAVRDFHVADGMAAEKTHVAYNGVDLEKFRPGLPTAYLHRELGLPADTPLVGSIGQIGLRKGQDVLLRAAAMITPSCPKVHYLIVGERNSSKDESRQFEESLHEVSQGPLRDCPNFRGHRPGTAAQQWSAMVDENGTVPFIATPLKGKVHFLGRRNDVCRLLPELTLLVHAARQEPLGRVLLEAAAAGIAIVATNVGGTPEIFPPACGAARLVPPDDADSLAAAMLELLGDPALRGRLASAARRRAEEQFDIRTTVKELIRHYRIVCS
jgi:glycosyltransferase involved in cell wall biosynthesis